jgi:pyridoxamine 5'-phosphate oxidase
MSSIADIRKDYQLQSLLESDIKKNPIDQFSTWWNQAIESQIDEVNAMTLATVDANHKPSARIVLLKEFDENGFVFFTNYNSKKGLDMLSNKNVALVFFWKELERQVRIEGKVEKVSGDISDTYFNSRPEMSRIGAWASPQSTVIPSREILETNFQQYQTEFEKKEINRPQHWGGYIVKPELIEFWQGRSSRLHDRIVYGKDGDNEWKINRVAP